MVGLFLCATIVALRTGYQQRYTMYHNQLWVPNPRDLSAELWHVIDYTPWFCSAMIDCLRWAGQHISGDLIHITIPAHGAQFYLRSQWCISMKTHTSFYRKVKDFVHVYFFQDDSCCWGTQFQYGTSSSTLSKGKWTLKDFGYRNCLQQYKIRCLTSVKYLLFCYSSTKYTRSAHCVWHFVWSGSL